MINISLINVTCLQVKATEIVSGKEYKVGSTLRFARVEKFRNDRSWLNSMTLAEFRAMKIMADGKLSSRHVAHEGILEFLLLSNDLLNNNSYIR